MLSVLFFFIGLVIGLIIGILGTILFVKSKKTSVMELKEESEINCNAIKMIDSRIVEARELVNLVKKGQSIGCYCNSAILKGIKLLAKEPDWEEQIDDETLNILVDLNQKRKKISKSINATVVKVDKKNSHVSNNEYIEFEDYQYEDENDNENTSSDITYLYNQEDGSFDIYEDYQKDISSWSDKFKDYLIPLNDDASMAFGFHLGMNKKDFAYSYGKMLNRIKENFYTSLIDINKTEVNYVDEDFDYKAEYYLESLLVTHTDRIKLEAEKTTEISLNKVAQNYFSNKGYNTLILNNGYWKALTFMLYFEEIYRTDWDGIKPYPDNFRDGGVYTLSKENFDKKSSFILKSDLSTFLKEQISYFGFWRNYLYKDYEDCVLKVEKTIDSFLVNIPKRFILAICYAFLINYEKFSYFLPELICWNSDECFLVLSKTPRQKIKPRQKIWFNYMIKNDIPFKIINIEVKQ